MTRTKLDDKLKVQMEEFLNKQKTNEEKRKQHNEMKEMIIQKQKEESVKKKEEILKVFEKNKEMENMKVYQYNQKQEEIETWRKLSSQTGETFSGILKEFTGFKP